jgi:hypothetical protein
MESQILAVLTAIHNLGLSRLNKLVSLMDHAPTGIILMPIESANLVILIVKHVNTRQHNARNANQSISNKVSVVLISVCVACMETIRHNLVILTLLLQVCSH